ncbi:MAG TPA: alpha/beta hydrolase [Candidatus Obscuribacterales bacterium]
MKCAHVLPAVVLAWLVAFCLLPACFAQNTTDRVPKYIRIPVYFVTDRNREDKHNKDVVEFGCERKYRGICKHELFTGVAYCRIRNTENKPFKSCMGDIGWKETQHHGEGPDGVELTAGDTYAARQDKLFSQLGHAAGVTADKEMFMFVPGYMSTFESGLRSAARLSYFAERPVLLYSWPSKGKFTQYFADEATIEWTQDHFNDILGRVSSLGELNPPVHCRLYAHSMGGRLVLRATPYLKSSKSLREVAVVCPDVDDGVVKHYAAKYFDGSTDILVRLYISKRDAMLKLSQAVHGGYGRLGEDRQPLDSLLPQNAAKFVPAADATAEEQSCPESLHRKLLTIDFTAVDIGTVGHRIPVELLTGLSQAGQPYGNLKLRVVTAKGKVISDDTTANDGVVTVFKPGWRGTPIIGTLVRYRPRLRLLITKDWSLK